MKLGIAVAVVMMMTVAAPAPATDAGPAPADQATWRTTTMWAGPVAFQRNGETYRLSFWATDYPDGHDAITMVLRRVRDPDGSGPARSRQQHMRKFQGTQMVAADPDLASATVATGDRLAPYGQVDVEFAPTAPAERAPCIGAKRTVRKGRVNGTVRFASGTGFGDVVITSLRARLDSVEGTVCGHGDPPPRCPRAASYLWTQDGDFGASVYRPAGGSVAVVRADRDGDLTLRDPDVEGYVSENSVTRLPQDHARFAADLRAATIRGLRGTDVRQRASFTAESGTAQDVEQCDGTHEEMERRRRGTVSGTLRFAFFIGPDETLVDRPLPARVYRRTVRPSG